MRKRFWIMLGAREQTIGRDKAALGAGAALLFGAAIALFLTPVSAKATDTSSETRSVTPTVTQSADQSYVGTQTDVPWYRSFTLRSNEVDDNAFLPFDKPDVEFHANSQWGITIGLTEQDPVLESKDRMSAGAFYNISPRIRLGGELSFTAPGELRVSTPKDHVLPLQPNDSAPVVRIESSIRF